MRSVRTLLAGLVAFSILLVGCSDDSSIPPPTAPSATAPSRVADALVTLAGLETALRTGDVAGASGFAAPTTGELLGSAASNVTKLRLDDVALRYLQDLTSTTIAGTAEFGPDSWQATVAVQYRLPGWDQRTTQVETVFTFVPGSEGRQLVAAVGAAEGRTPLWLSGPVTPISVGRTLVLARGSNGSRESRLAQQAIVDVGRVLPDWKGRLVIEAPSTEAEFDRVLGSSREQYANIAAVTASVDGSTASGSPVHVFLNPALFAKLGPRAARIVVSHESTHVATDAPFIANMPTWLIEGFADYVALAHAGIGVQKAAAQVLDRIEADGLPDALPSDADLSSTASGLGAAYEEAWLVNRSLARAYGEQKLIAFYNAISAGASVAEGFGKVLGTTETQFVKRWRVDLEELVGARQG